MRIIFSQLIPQSIDFVKDKGVKVEMITNDSVGIVYGITMKADIYGISIDSTPDIGAIELFQ